MLDPKSVLSSRETKQMKKGKDKMERGFSQRPALPQSVRAIAEQAENFVFYINIPFKHWVRAAETLHQEASFAMGDGDYARAYMMLYRHSLLVLKHLPAHPQFRETESRRAFRVLSNRLDGVLEDLEKIKPILAQEYDEWQLMQSDAQTAPHLHTKAPSTYADFAVRDVSLGGIAQVLDTFDNQDLAVDLAQQELAKRDKAKQESKTTRKMSQNRDAGLQNSMENDFQKQMEAARRALSLEHEVDRYGSRAVEPSSPRKVNMIRFHYPLVTKSRRVELDDARTQQVSSSSGTGPSRPPKLSLLSDLRDASAPCPNPKDVTPAVPRKVPLEHQDMPAASLSPTVQPPVPPKSQREGPLPHRKDRLAFKPGAYLENGDPIRSVFVPSNLRTTFLRIASGNTMSGLEMCGILCGLPINNALFVRCLLIPDQKCTSDTCETENEGAIFDYCASEDLLVLGWIHTHPIQTCFMSSRDLHTHAGYQVMMPESIAIVCAPRFEPSYGIFRLTHPPGLNYILNCKHHDTFHQHSIDSIYRDTEHPDGHVYENDSLPFYVHDLRTK